MGYGRSRTDSQLLLTKISHVVCSLLTRNLSIVYQTLPVWQRVGLQLCGGGGLQPWRHGVPGAVTYIIDSVCEHWHTAARCRVACMHRPVLDIWRHRFEGKFGPLLFRLLRPWAEQIQLTCYYETPSPQVYGNNSYCSNVASVYILHL